MKLMSKFYKSLFLLGLCSFAHSSLAQTPASPSSPKGPTLVVRMPSTQAAGDTRTDYDRAILELLLTKTVAKYGPFELVGSVRMPQSRALASLKMGELVDAVPTMTSAERERDYLPIRHDIHRGLMGVKLFLVPKKKLALFAGITKIEDLKLLTAAQGHDWPDVQVLRAAGLPVVTSPTYEGLFKMLATNRFDYFPRALPEIWDELASHTSEDLAIEPNIAIIYTAPAYIFVNKANTKLAARLEEGFEIAIKDGSFHKLFMQKHGENIARAQLKKRRLFYLDNPVLPDSYKTIRPDLSFAF